MPLKLYLLLIIFFAGFKAVTQPDNFIRYTYADGLADDKVTCMLTDSHGFIWVGTLNGLSRFDGTHFYTFPHGSFESKNLAGDIIIDLEEDGDHIWVAHRFGLSRINRYSFECENFKSKKPATVYTHRRAVKDIFRDNEGRIWLASDQQLMQFDKKENTFITVVDFGKQFAGKAKQVSKIIQGEGEQLWLFMTNYWLRFDSKHNQLDPREETAIPVKLLQGQNIRLITYWNTFTSSYFVGYDDKNKSVSVLEKESPGAVSKAVNFYVDSSNRILVNREQNGVSVLNDNPTGLSQKTAGLLIKEDWQPFNFIHYSKGIYYRGSAKGLFAANSRSGFLKKYYFRIKTDGSFGPLPDILDVAEYGPDEWLIATKGGLYKMNRKDGQVSGMDRWKDSIIHELLVMPDKSVWLSTDKTLWHYYPGIQKNDKPVSLESYAVSIIPYNGKILVGTRSDGIVIFDTRKSLVKNIKENGSGHTITSNRITSVNPLGVKGKYLITYNRPAGHYSYFNIENEVNGSDSIPLSAFALNEAFSLTAAHTAPGQLWIGSYLGGAFLFDSAANKWTNLTTDSGMGSNTLVTIFKDDYQKTWLLTNIGLDVYDNSRKKVFSFPLRFSTGSVGGFVSSEGKLIFFDKESIAEAVPSAFNIEARERDILFSHIKQGDKQFLLRDHSLRLSYNNNSFTISFSLQKPDADYMVNYAYRLSEKEEWKDIGNETLLNFAAMQPGKYNLQIRATDEFGQWSYYSAILTILVKPPFWQTPWFLAAVVACFLVLIRIFFTRRQKRRIRLLQKENEIIRLQAEKEISIARERERIIADLHDDVGATLSSMHIYGDLAREIWDTKPEQSKDMVSKITTQAKDLMNRMGDIVWSLKPFGEEKNTLSGRLKNYSNELLASKNIECTFSIDEIADKNIINPVARKNILLIAKEAMNNIAKYSQASHVSVNLKQVNEDVILEIRDNGVGFVKETLKSGNGLQNIEQRCALLNGRCIIETSPGGGTGITCSFPIAIISHAG